MVQVITLSNGNEMFLYERTKIICNKIIKYFLDNPNVNQIVLSKLAEKINHRPESVKNALLILCFSNDKKPVCRFKCSPRLSNNGFSFYRQYVLFIGDRKDFTKKKS